MVQPLNFDSIGDALAGGISTWRERNRLKDAFAQAGGDYNKLFQLLIAQGNTKEAAAVADYATAQAQMQHNIRMEKPEIQRMYEWAYPPAQDAAPAAPMGAVPTAAPTSAPAQQPMRVGPDGRPTPQDFVQSQLATKSMTPAQKSVDEKFAKDYADWVAGGGYAGLQQQQEQLRNGISALDKSDAISGPGIGLLSDVAASGGVTGGLAGAAQSYFLPQSVNVRQQIEQAIQQSLRQVLGSQYTQVEGENLLRRTFDPRLDEKVNAQRAQMVLDQLDARAKAKQEASQYYEQNGTLKGWQGHLLSSQSEIQVPTGDSGKIQERLSPYDAGQEAPPSAPAQATIGGSGKTQLEGPGAAPPIPDSGDKNRLISAYRRFKDADPATLKALMEKFDSVYQYPGLAAEILGELRAGR